MKQLALGPGIYQQWSLGRFDHSPQVRNGSRCTAFGDACSIPEDLDTTRVTRQRSSKIGAAGSLHKEPLGPQPNPVGKVARVLSLAIENGEYIADPS
jgi:hypothetical protein